MRLAELLSPDRIGIRKKTDANDSPLDKAGALHALADMLGKGASVEVSDVERVLTEREALQSTGIGEGVAIPHGALTNVDAQCAALLLVPDGLDFAAIDSRAVHIVFAVVGPKRATGEHLKTLARVSRLLKSAEFRERLLSQENPQSAFDLIAKEEAASPTPTPYREANGGGKT
jgi:PTS system nitrogen regulatory IIA component